MNSKKLGALIAVPVLASAVLIPLTAGSAHAADSVQQGPFVAACSYQGDLLTGVGNPCVLIQTTPDMTTADANAQVGSSESLSCIASFDPTPDPAVKLLFGDTTNAGVGFKASPIETSGPAAQVPVRQACATTY
jgi:hypothetical protein